MSQIELHAAGREVLGKKVRFLRRQGITPVHLFGHDIKSKALQCDAVQLQQVLARAGRTRLVSLKLEGEKRPRNVVVREVQRDQRTDGLLHVDLYQVKMTEKIRVEVPIVLVGEAPALRSRENMLSHELNSLTVECLPDEIPASAVVDISSLDEVEQAIRVEDVPLDEEVTVLNDPGLVVVKISSRPRERVEEEVVEVAEEEAAATPEEVAAVPEAPSPEAESKEE